MWPSTNEVKAMYGMVTQSTLFIAQLLLAPLLARSSLRCSLVVAFAVHCSAPPRSAPRSFLTAMLTRRRLRGSSATSGRQRIHRERLQADFFLWWALRGQLGDPAPVGGADRRQRCEYRGEQVG